MDIATPNQPPPARRLIDALGGVRTAARKLGRRPSTVQYWYDTGLVPAKQQPNALETAQREGVEWAPADFYADRGSQQDAAA